MGVAGCLAGLAGASLMGVAGCLAGLAGIDISLLVVTTRTREVAGRVRSARRKLVGELGMNDFTGCRAGRLLVTASCLRGGGGRLGT